jgi:NAD(P)-dependent dehydrogenase (short-subunit alcohol dehydrogenase family)
MRASQPTAAEATHRSLFDLVNGEDVRDSAQLDAVIDRLARLGIVLCSAGVAGDSIHTEEISDDEWNRVRRST